MLGVLANSGAVLVGGVVGLLFREKIKEKYTSALMAALALVSLGLGIVCVVGVSDTLCLILCVSIGTLLGELPAPVIEWGITPLHFRELLANYTVFGMGFPAVDYFIKGLPLMVTCYIIAFGDFVLAETVVKEADEVRQDEYVEFNPSRSNVISGIRNLILSLFAPYAPLSGPLWAGGTIAVAERYKHGREAMDSIYGGVGSYILAMAVAGLILPIVSLLKPALPIAMSLTMLVQGFACCYIAMNMVKTREQQGAAAITAIVVAFQSAAIGLAVGIAMHLILGVLVLEEHEHVEPAEES